jgi:hypothetical protein
MTPLEWADQNIGGDDRAALTPYPNIGGSPSRLRYNSSIIVRSRHPYSFALSIVGARTLAQLSKFVRQIFMVLQIRFPFWTV